jgi:acylphosphatase
VKTVQIILHGHVQGVGMRYFIQRHARKYNIKGFVRNRSDRTVEAVLQGPTRSIDIFLDFIKNRSPGHIALTDITELNNTKEYSHFQIKLF